jgi:hypothetical protein
VSRFFQAAGKGDKLAALADTASKEEKTNISFVSLLLLGKVDECIALLVSTNRLAEAALFARTYVPFFPVKFQNATCQAYFQALRLVRMLLAARARKWTRWPSSLWRTLRVDPAKHHHVHAHTSSVC